MNILQQRAQALKAVRDYFFSEKVMEVDSELLSPYSVTDPYMSAMRATSANGRLQGYLQTSPEYAMKKLLSTGCGDIYQLGKVFRADESGKNHSPEFTMLEWYRLGWDHHQLMEEVRQVIQLVTGIDGFTKLTYEQAFESALGLNPFTATVRELEVLATSRLGDIPEDMLRDNYLSLLFSECVETGFEKDKVTFIYDFPASQASLAKVQTRSDNSVACRFEAFAGGLELANGFWELTDAEEQLKRFEEDNRQRALQGNSPIAVDSELITALKRGLPECSGVAIGFDRLMMIKQREDDIHNILPSVLYRKAD
ncbi:EF-P lysine aminoacylase EpmA [Aliikangiella sp. G2MR2-5]|uniref:EF-P lysine aminoacylase EpmA n=1 Tax=Aliikangiella sp. G2MR2-5 TaxID=2788943 RepID=UPI00352CA17B